MHAPSQWNGFRDISTTNKLSTVTNKEKGQKNKKQKQTNNNNKGDNELFENSKLEENMPILLA